MMKDLKISHIESNQVSDFLKVIILAGVVE
jgi:hypothetical protein